MRNDDPPTPSCASSVRLQSPFLRRNLMHGKGRKSNPSNPNGGKRRPQPSGATKYHAYRLMTDNQGNRTFTTRQLTQFECPICGDDESMEANLKDVWVHCSTAHNDFLDFKPLRTKDGGLHLLISEKDNVCFPINKQNDKNKLNRTTRLTFSDVYESNVDLPQRQYYRDLAFDKTSLAEWLFDQTDNNDSDWQTRVDHSALSELTDVSTKEKHLFLLWNDFMQRNPVLTEIQLPSNLHDFVVEHSTTVATHGLEIPLIAHITNIWLEGVISRQNMVECMRIYDKCGFSKTKRLA